MHQPRMFPLCNKRIVNFSISTGRLSLHTITQTYCMSYTAYCTCTIKAQAVSSLKTHGTAGSCLRLSSVCSKPTQPCSHLWSLSYVLPYQQLRLERLKIVLSFVYNERLTAANYSRRNVHAVILHSHYCTVAYTVTQYCTHQGAA